MALEVERLHDFISQAVACINRYEFDGRIVNVKVYRTNTPLEMVMMARYREPYAGKTLSAKLNLEDGVFQRGGGRLIYDYLDFVILDLNEKAIAQLESTKEH